jgi:hypothetical protein
MFRSLALAALLILPSVPAQKPQPARPALKPDESKVPDKIQKDDTGDSNFPDEMRIRMEIARAEEEHKKVIEDAEKLSNLSDEVAKSFDDHKKLAPEDEKKLGTIEKLAKRVLKNAGGDEVDDNAGPSEPLTLAEAVDKLSATAGDIKKDMKAETRFVVSASVIAKSNEVIRLARFIKRSRKSN